VTLDHPAGMSHDLFGRIGLSLAAAVGQAVIEVSGKGNLLVQPAASPLGSWKSTCQTREPTWWISSQSMPWCFSWSSVPR
jgi:hypothetical protein